MSDEVKRQYLRHALDAKIDVIEGSLGVKLRFETSNVSQGGVFIESDLLYDEGEVIWFSFTLPGAMEIRTRGRVVWAVLPSCESATGRSRYSFQYRK